MRKLYFMSENGIDWHNCDTGDERKARKLANDKYPQGIYGSVYLGILDGEIVRKLYVRSPKINEKRVYWKPYRAPGDTLVLTRTLVFGRVYWLSVANNETTLLRSTNIRAAKQVAGIHPSLMPGARVDIYCQSKGADQLLLVAVGDCDSKRHIKWRRSVIETINCDIVP